MIAVTIITIITCLYLAAEYCTWPAEPKPLQMARKPRHK